MNASMSLYLEMARFVATAIVLFGHAKVFYLPLAEFCDRVNPGRDGVIIFFVLSGYVISWCGQARDHTVQQFAVNRAARVYSVALPAVALSLLASLLSSWWLQEPLAYPLQKLWLYLPIYLSFTGSLWNLGEVPPLNFPYWSINYEVWYYAFFALAFYLRSHWRWPALALLACAVGPRILELFPLWLMGSLLYFQQHRFKLSRGAARALVFATITAYLAAKFLDWDNSLDALARQTYRGWTGQNPVEPLLGDYAIGLLVLLNFAGALRADFQWPAGVRAATKAVAACSFSIYLYHMPLFDLVRLAWPRDDSLLAYLLIVLGSLLTIAALARVTEQRKDAYRRLFTRLLSIRWPVVRRS